MTDRRTKMVERCRALLAKAASTEHEGERDTFEAGAVKIMAEYEIEERELIDAGSSDFGLHVFPLDHWGEMKHAVGGLWGSVASMHGALLLINQRRTSFDADTMRFGWSWEAEVRATDSQWARVELIGEHLERELVTALVQTQPASLHSFAAAWSVEVVKRLKAAQANAYAEAGTALVPTTQAAEDAARADGTVWADNPQEQAPETDLDSLVQGMVLGETADLGQRRLEGS